MSNLSPELESYLQKWHATSTGKKAAQGNIIDLPFAAFLNLFEERQLKSLQKAIDGGYLHSMQGRDQPYSLVLTWRSYAACSSGIFNSETACVCARFLSAAKNMPQAGDKLRPGHIASISKSLTGVEKTPEHRAAISEGKKGVKIAGWSPERRAARSVQRQAQEAAKKGSSLGC